MADKKLGQSLLKLPDCRLENSEVETKHKIIDAYNEITLLTSLQIALRALDHIDLLHNQQLISKNGA